jgi:hypothetical protein
MKINTLICIFFLTFLLGCGNKDSGESKMFHAELAQLRTQHVEDIVNLRNQLEDLQRGAGKCEALQEEYDTLKAIFEQVIKAKILNNTTKELVETTEEAK